MAVETIGVVGSGTMGNGIAHTAAQYGRRVILVDVEKGLLDRAMATIDRNLQRGVDKGKLNVAEKSAILGRIEATTATDRLAQADFVVEAIFEDEAASSSPATPRPSRSPGWPP
jgi:3-hydroxybutyryl-CoA dehydrogenase